MSLQIAIELVSEVCLFWQPGRHQWSFSLGQVAILQAPTQWAVLEKMFAGCLGCVTVAPAILPTFIVRNMWAFILLGFVLSLHEHQQSAPFMC